MFCFRGNSTSVLVIRLSITTSSALVRILAKRYDVTLDNIYLPRRRTRLEDRSNTERQLPRVFKHIVLGKGSCRVVAPDAGGCWGVPKLGSFALGP